MSNTPYTAIDHETVKGLINVVNASPELEYTAEIELIESFKSLEEAKLELKLESDAQFLLAEGKTVKDKEAMVTAATEEKARALIDKQVDHLKKKAAYNKKVNMFAAARKQLGAIESMLNARL